MGPRAVAAGVSGLLLDTVMIGTTTVEDEGDPRPDTVLADFLGEREGDEEGVGARHVAEVKWMPARRE